MKIEYFHASKFGNGAAVAAEFKQQMAAKGVAVDVHHIREVRPDRAFAGRPVSVQLSRPVRQADPGHAAVPEASGAPCGHAVRDPDHRGRAKAV
jgi:hypothetical protein